jgi:hypothetical protein
VPAANPVDALSLVVRKMNTTGQAFMLTGSVAALFYGRRRTADDVDVVVDCTGLNIERFMKTFAPEYFLDAESIAKAVAAKTPFYALPLFGGPKVDFLPLVDAPFDQVAFMRREVVEWFGASLFLERGMDLAIHTLRCANAAPSPRLLADAREILSNDAVDDAHEFYRWIRELGLQRELEASRTSEYDA